MRDDPLVEEARRAGQIYIDSFNGDWNALLADLRRRSEEAGRTVVSLPPRPAGTRPNSTKKAS